MSKRKSILVLYPGDDWKLAKPDHSEPHAFGYRAWGEYCKTQGIDFYRASMKWYKNGAFSKAWKFENGAWKKVAKLVRPTVVYDKAALYDKDGGGFEAEHHAQKLKIRDRVPVLNDPEFSLLCDSKIHQAVMFYDVMPRCSLVHPGDVVEAKNGAPIVLKNFYGSGGKQVEIIKKAKVTVKHLALHQEFVEASKNGKLADIRVVFIGEKPVYVLSRIARPGSLFTNFHQGASITFLKLLEAKEAVALAKNIAKRLSAFPKKVFSIDFLRDAKSGKLFMIEMNTMPGIDVFNDESRGVLDAFVAKLTSYLLEEK